MLGKKGKPFSDVDIIKKSIIEVVSCIDPRNISQYKELPLSRTTTSRQHELATNLKQQLNSKFQKEVFYSIAIDESIDNTDNAQVLVFIRAITEDFHCFEELLCLCTSKDRTRGIDIFNAFKEKCNEAKLSFANLVSVCTDGAPAMKGVREGFIGLLKKELPVPDPESLVDPVIYGRGSILTIVVQHSSQFVVQLARHVVTNLLNFYKTNQTYTFRKTRYKTL